jgi:hypothetical protein
VRLPALLLVRWRDWLSTQVVLRSAYTALQPQAVPWEAWAAVWWAER